MPSCLAKAQPRLFRDPFPGTANSGNHLLNRKSPTQCSTGTCLDAPHRRDTARLQTDADSIGHSSAGRSRPHPKCGPAPTVDHVQGLTGVAGAFRFRCRWTAFTPLRILCANRMHGWLEEGPFAARRAYLPGRQGDGPVTTHRSSRAIAPTHQRAGPAHQCR